MSLYKQAWESFRADIKANKKRGWKNLCIDKILSLMDMYLEEARKEAKETQKELAKKMKEYYKERGQVEYFE